MNQLSGCQCFESSEQGRNQGLERLDAVRGRDENDHSNRESDQILLVRKVLIRRHEGVEAARGELQQLTVSGSYPADRRDGPDLVPR